MVTKVLEEEKSLRALLLAFKGLQTLAVAFGHHHAHQVEDVAGEEDCRLHQ